GVRRLVDDGALVEALEVDRVDGSGCDEGIDQLRGPGARRVELEAQAGVALEPAGDRLEARRLAEAQRDDEAQRLRLTPEHLVQRPPRLAQRQVERGAVER